jgi:uncharacterized SAM-binding protein YcdF (DUF218 family)
VTLRGKIEQKRNTIEILKREGRMLPRAIGAFRRAGFPVEAYPVAYTTVGPADIGHLSSSIEGGVIRTDAAVHEWIGLIAYRLLGRTNVLFPGP